MGNHVQKLIGEYWKTKYTVFIIINCIYVNQVPNLLKATKVNRKDERLEGENANQ